MAADERSLPTDEYSRVLASMRANPSAIEKQAIVDLTDFYGNAETWIVTTLRVNSHDTVFLQRNNSEGGQRWILPVKVTNTIARQRDASIKVTRRRAGHAAAATRRAKREGGGR